MQQRARRDGARREAREGAAARCNRHQSWAVGHSERAHVGGEIAEAGEGVVHVVALAGREAVLSHLHGLQLGHVGQLEARAVAANAVPTHETAQHLQVAVLERPQRLQVPPHQIPPNGVAQSGQVRLAHHHHVRRLVLLRVHHHLLLRRRGQCRGQELPRGAVQQHADEGRRAHRGDGVVVGDEAEDGAVGERVGQREGEWEALGVEVDEVSDEGEVAKEDVGLRADDEAKDGFEALWVRAREEGNGLAGADVGEEGGDLLLRQAVLLAAYLLEEAQVPVHRLHRDQLRRAPEELVRRLLH